MNITKIKIRLKDMPRLKAVACLIIDGDVAINDVKIIDTGKFLCVEFPKSKDRETIVPLTAISRGKIEKKVLAEYRRKRDEKA